MLILRYLKKRTFTISIGTVAAALFLNIFLNWLLIPKFGYLAAAYTTMIGYLALLGFHYWIVRRTAKEFDGVYNKKFFGTYYSGTYLCGNGNVGIIQSVDFAYYIFGDICSSIKWFDIKK